MDISSILASVVGVFGVVMGISPVLQITRIRRRGRSDDVSAGQLGIVVFGTALWLAYGLSIANPTIIVSNVAATAVNALALATVLWYRGGRAATAAPAPA